MNLSEKWGEKELNKIAEVSAGNSAPKDASLENEGKYFVRMSDLGKYGLTSNLVTVRDKTQEKIRVYPKGTIVIPKSGASILLNHRGILGLDAGISNHLAGIIPSSKIDTKFLYYYLCSLDFGEFVGDKSYPSLKISEIEKIKIPVPPLSTQKKIVQILERAEKLQEKRKQANELTKQLPQSVFLEMFGDPNNSNHPITTINEVCEKVTDGTHKTPQYVKSGIPFLRVTDLTNSNDSKKFIREEEHKELIKRCKPEKGDVLYTKNGTIGIAKTIGWDYEFSIFVSLCLLKPKKEIILPDYLEAFLNTPFALKQAMSHSKKGTITNLHLIEIKQIKLPLPPIREQEKFIKKIKQIESARRKQGNSDKEINLLFDSLMQKAFNGKLVV